MELNFADHIVFLFSLLYTLKSFFCKSLLSSTKIVIFWQGQVEIEEEVHE